MFQRKKDNWKYCFYSKNSKDTNMKQKINKKQTDEKNSDGWKTKYL